jgi:hypothetical protein
VASSRARSAVGRSVHCGSKPGIADRSTGISTCICSFGQPRDVDVEGHGVGDDVGHLGHQPAGAGQREGRRALAVDDRLERLRPGLAQDGGDQRRVVVARHLVERVVALGQVDRAAPVAQPDVEAVLQRTSTIDRGIGEP